MSRTFGLAVPLAVVAVSLLVAGTGSAAPKKLTGTVGPGYTIGLRVDGTQVAKVKAGRYRLVVSDRSSIHDFHLSGPGVNNVVTTVAETGTRSVVLTLKKGVYRFVCDPHANVMHGSFRVA